jgi:aminoglycoside 3-N-acetyltransferase
MAENITAGEIINGLRAAGIHAGSKLLVHSSLSSFGRVEGGAEAVIDALLKVVAGRGTVLVPTLTGSEELSPDNPPVFDPVNTPCWTGTIPETFRKRADAIRSLHPTHSAAAIGADAAALTGDHMFSITPCDEFSPYGKLAALPDGYILLIGVHHQSNTTFHHVEEMVGTDYHLQPAFAKAKLVLDSEVIYRHYLLHQYGTGRNFNIMEPIFLERGIQKSFQIGGATLRLVRASDMVAVTARALAANGRILCR